MSFSRSTVTRIAFPSPATITPGPGSYDVRLPRAFATTEDSHHTPTHPATHPHHHNAAFHSPPPSTRARRMSSPCSAADMQSQAAGESATLALLEANQSSPLDSTPLASSPCSSSSPYRSPTDGSELTSSAQKRRLARQVQRGIAMQPLAPIVTSPEVLRDKAREYQHQPSQQPSPQQHVSPTSTTSRMNESAVEKETRTAVTATPLHGQISSVAPSSCRRFRFAQANEGNPTSSATQQHHPITALSHSMSPSTATADVSDVRIQRLEERCRELEEAKRRSHAAWMEELSSQALIKQQLTAQRQMIEELERRAATLTQQRDTHATRVQQLQAEMNVSAQKQTEDGGRLTLLQEQHTWLDEVSEQQSAAIAALEADVAAKEQQLETLQSCLDAERRRYEELRGGVDGGLASAQQLRVTLEMTQAELQAVLQDKEQLVLHMDALERQVDEAAAREQRRATQDRESNRRAEAERKQLVAQCEDSESERLRLLQQTTQLEVDIVHWQHKYQNEADNHTALRHQRALTLHSGADGILPHISSITSDASSSSLSEQKEERVSRLAAVRRQLTEMRDNISQRLAAIRPVKRKDDRLLALQSELERSEAEMERLLKEHEATWQQVYRAKRERCLSCGGFHHGSHGSNQRETTQQSSADGEAPPAVADAKDELLSEMSAFNQRLQADNTALREKVEALTRERNELLRRAAQRDSGQSAGSRMRGSSTRSKRDKRARDGDDKENEAVLQPVEMNAASGNRKHRRSTTGSGGGKLRQSEETPTKG